MSEPRYTLAEADRIRRMNECVLHGHDWNIIQSLQGPHAISCGTCGWSGSVAMGGRPELPEPPR